MGSDVVGIENDVVHAGDVNRERVDDVAGEGPVAVDANRVPRSDKSRLCTCARCQTR